MTESKIVDTKPTVLTLEPGTYYWCSCGLSDKQPFCNGAHQGTSLAPTAFDVTEAKPIALCLCKKTKNAPFCDGTHSGL